ncbi:MAG: hypothetical protein AABW82_04680 [Nanoarchaeota archaeon]
MSFKRRALHKNAWKTWSLYTLVGLLAFTLFYTSFGQNQVFFSPTVQQFEDRSLALHTEFDNLQIQFNEKKADYVACITDLSDKMSNLNTNLDTLDEEEITERRAEIAAKNEECQAIYEDIANNIASSVLLAPCDRLPALANELYSEIQERFNEEDALVESEDENADPQTLEQIVDLRDNVALLELNMNEFCQTLRGFPDPCTALGNTEYNGRSQNP